MVVQDFSQDSSPIGTDASLPAAVNWHFWPWCNYGCTFCFAQFDDLPKIDRLPKEIAILVPKQLAMAGAKKITFVGGEPTMCPYLPELLEASKDVGLTTCIVSNGTGLSESFLSENHQLMLVPKDNHICYETDDECTIFYAAYPVNWKQLAGLTEVPGIDPEDM